MEISKKDKLKKVIVPLSILIAVILIGTSFALWQIVLKQTDDNTITTGCFKLEYTNESDAINLNDAIPLTDEEGKKLVPYSFTLTNTCRSKANYVINLETISQGENILRDEFIKANLVKESNEVFLGKLTAEHENQEKVIKDSNKAYMLDQGTLAGNQSINYSLRLWIASDVTDVEEIMDRTFASKITITTEHVPKIIENDQMLYVKMKKQAVLDNIPSEYVTKDTGIEFSVYSSDTNGKGVYTLSDTIRDEYPIYYFRGAVENNNVKFANLCWKIVRTTETGGIKLVYNGLPGNSVGCTNTTSVSKLLKDNVAFNTSDKSPADVGYMYGTRYESNRKIITESYSSETKWIYGNDVEYKDGKYILKDTVEYSPSTFTTNANQGFNAHRYTCFTTENTCTSVNYLYYKEYYITLNDGKTIDDALKEMITESTNEFDSPIKAYIDNWYKNNMLDYTTYLEDTIWCNDRSIYTKNAWDKDAIFSDTDHLYFRGRENEIKRKPSVECPNVNDRFTVNQDNGNGKLTYPVALLTRDEVLLAGIVNSSRNTTNYLRSGEYWTMTPESFISDHAYNYTASDALGTYNVSDTSHYKVRPSISLKPGTMIDKGDGSLAAPFEIKAN